MVMYMKNLKPLMRPYPYYLLKKIILPIDEQIKKELIQPSNDEFIIDLLFYSVSPAENPSSNNLYCDDK